MYISYWMIIPSMLLRILIKYVVFLSYLTIYRLYFMIQIEGLFHNFS